ncbi:MAG TPA: glycoside hydrolase family 44 protein [Bryobacteraceae bacterium]|nr:glycoside hydrolase family 44 protein [Bryobacteraceae bacterium]
MTYSRFLLPVCLVTAAAVAPAQNPSVTVSVDAAANRRPISPEIYGVAHASPSALAELNAPVNRHGGNTTSRYNWQLNADNRGFDWYFESIAYSSSTPGELLDTFIAGSRGAAAEPMLTIPMAGWVAKLGTNRGKLASYSIAKYGAQTDRDWQWFPDAGNGILTNGQLITWNDPNDASVPANSAFQQGWVQHLTGTWGTAGNGGVRYYILDNEPSIWHSTHRDIHPTGATMEEVRDKILNYAAMIKTIDPGALIIGPEEWGWSGYFFSGYDQQYGAEHGWSYLPDRAAHGGWDYLPWLLDQLRQNNQSAGRRLLDVFTVHYYPQGGEFSNDTSSSMQLRRNRSTRSLWDPSYVDETWIADKVMLVPRLRNWVNSYYPGTKIGLTEYNWGAENHINGATTQADIYGIFGREGLDYGARWTTPASSTPTFKAMKMYRNYDGNRSTFGDTSVKATVPTPDNVSAFAAERSPDGALTVMVISKYLSGNTTVTVSLAGFSSQGVAQPWQLTSANQISRLADVTFSENTFAIVLPPQSVTLFVIPGAGGNNPPVAVAAASPLSGTAPLAVSFDGDGSSDSDGTIASYAWNFGDGATGSGVTVSHTYNAAGTYTATLTVTDNQGATSSDSVSIAVSSDVPAAPSGLSASVTGTTVNLRWTDNANNEDGFYIERALKTKKPAFSRIASVAANAATYSNTTVPRGTYLYRAQAFRGGKVSAYSNQVQARVR